MTIPRGAYQQVSDTAATVVAVTKNISAGDFTSSSNSTVIDIDNSEGWPTADIVVHVESSGGAAPSGSAIELYMTCREIFGNANLHESDPSDTNLAGFIGSREMSGRSSQSAFFSGVPVPKGKYRLSFRVIGAAIRSGGWIKVRHTTGAPKG